MIALREVGVAEKNIYMDKQSGADFERVQYRRMLRRLMAFVTLLAVCALVEFLLDGKIYQNMPFWFGYLTDAVCLTAAAAICCRALKAACEKE